MKIDNIEIIEENSKYDFEDSVKEAIRHRAVLDIKFSVTPDIHSTGLGGSYTSGEKYYAMIIYEGE